MRIFQMITLATGIGLVGAAGIGADYVLQEQKAQGHFDTATYVEGLFDRFGNDGGFLGLLFRDSAAVDLAMPEPPTGWDAWYIDETHMEAVFSDAQYQARAAEFEKVEAQVPELDDLSETDQQLATAYFDDTSTAYTSDDNVLLLFVQDKNNLINQPVLRKMTELSEAHFDAISTKQDWRSFDGQMWQEVFDPVTRSGNGARPHKLRMFEAKFGSITVFLETRAAEAALVQFFEGFDLTGLRKLANTGARDAEALALQTTPDVDGPMDRSLRPRLRPAHL